jgi:hypothetical protein
VPTHEDIININPFLAEAPNLFSHHSESFLDSVGLNDVLVQFLL